MFKRNTVYAILVSALAVATLCFFSTLAAAQKGPGALFLAWVQHRLRRPDRLL